MFLNNNNVIRFVIHCWEIKSRFCIGLFRYQHAHRDFLKGKFVKVSETSNLRYRFFIKFKEAFIWPNFSKLNKGMWEIEANILLILFKIMNKIYLNHLQQLLSTGT